MPPTTKPAVVDVDTVIVFTIQMVLVGVGGGCGFMPLLTDATPAAFGAFTGQRYRTSNYLDNDSATALCVPISDRDAYCFATDAQTLPASAPRKSDIGCLYIARCCGLACNSHISRYVSWGKRSFNFLPRVVGFKSVKPTSFSDDPLCFFEQGHPHPRVVL
jgi:hypothetical protein